jgi:isopropylmalate/homocitrate/citramalate synthase
MKFVRIGQNADEIESTKDYIIKAKEEGLEVMVNFMKTYIISPKEFAKKAELLRSWGADCVYVVDSSGGMLPEQISDYFNYVKESVDIMIGLHCHNNIGLAVYNCLLAEECGYDFIDTTLQGVGRSAGNAMAESVIMTLEKKGVTTGFDIPRLLEYGYYVNKNIIGRDAINPLDLMCGYSDFHSSNLKDIYRCCLEKKVDPLRLIMSYCKYDKKGIDYQKLCEVAEELPIDSEDNPYDFRKYFESTYN